MAIAHEPDRVRRPDRIVVGAALIVTGAVWLLERAAVLDVSPALVPPLVLIGVGAVAMVTSLDGPHPALVVLGLTVGVASMLLAAIPLGEIGGGVGDRYHQVVTEEDLSESFRLAVGEMEIDLTDALITGTATLTAKVGIGSLVVVVPEELSVEVRAASEIGEIDLFGATASGTDLRRQGSFGASPHLTLDLTTVVGLVEVRR